MARNALRLGEHPHAVLFPHREPNVRGVAMGHNTEGIWQFVCGRCGYLEMYVLDANAIAFIRSSWPLVPSSQTGS
jgi:hypothetical protein